MSKMLAKRWLFAMALMVAGDLSAPRVGVAGIKRRPEPSMSRQEAISRLRMGQYFLDVAPWLLPWENIDARPNGEDWDRVESGDGGDDDNE
jgi:hypothetical protein